MSINTQENPTQPDRKTEINESTSILTKATKTDPNNTFETLQPNQTPLDRLSAYENLLFQAAITVTKFRRPAISESLNTLVNNQNQLLRNAVRNLVSKKVGGSSMKATSAVMAVMYGGSFWAPERVQSASVATLVLFMQHATELFPDLMDKGRNNTKGEKNFFNDLNVAVVNAVLAGKGINNKEVASLIDKLDRETYEARHNKEPENLTLNILPGKKVQAMLNPAGFGTGILGMFRIMRPLQTITYADLIGFHIDANRLVHHYLEYINPIRENMIGAPGRKEFDNGIRRELSKRYQSVSWMINEGYSNLNPVNYNQDLITASEHREHAIMIKLTLGMGIREAAMQDPEIAEIIDTHHTKIWKTIKTGARLIGLWNDCGSRILEMSPGQINSLFEVLYTCAKQNNYTSVEETLAPKHFIDLLENGDVSTSEIISFRKQMGDGLESIQDLDMLLNLIKDAAKGEHNIVLDSKGTTPNLDSDFKYRKDLLGKLSVYTDLLKTSLGAELAWFESLGNAGSEIARMIRDVVLYHDQLYRGQDYYSRDNSGLSGLPILHGQRLERDAVLYGAGNDETAVA